MREQVEVLEHIANVDALLENGVFFQLIQLVTLASVADVVAVDTDKTFVDALEMINGPQQGGLAGT
ncbi:hypothetical protein D3C87_1953160 [compost metagenome]